MRARKSLALLAAAAAVACAPDFAPRSVIENLRVLAIVAEPLELWPGQAGVGPGGIPLTSISLSARMVLDDGLPPDSPARAAPVQLQERWSFCPFSLGASVGYACVSPIAECDHPFPAGTAPAGFDPLAQARLCLAALGRAGGIPPTVPPDLSAVPRLDLVFRHVAVYGGVRRETVQIVPLYAQAPSPINLPPRIDQVTVDGTPVDSQPLTDFGRPTSTGRALGGGQELRVCANLSADSAQPYRDAAGGQVEAPVVSFYTTAGRFDFDRASGPSGCVKLRHQKVFGDGTGWMYVVARDLRGGADARGPYTFTFTAN